MNKNKGFGLIELMISILIASIIVTGLYSLLTSSVVNYGFSTASSGAAKTSRQVGNIFNTLISQAGFMGYKKVQANATHPRRDSQFQGNGAYGANPNWAQDQIIMGSNDGQRLKIRFYGSSIEDDLIGAGTRQANGYVLDCRGIGVPNDVQLELEFFVDANNGLVCSQNILVGGNANFDDQFVPGDQFVIDSTVKRLEILYGASVPGMNNTGYWRAAAINVAGGPNWNNVTNIRYALVTSVDTGQRVVRTAANNNQLIIFTPNEFIDNNNNNIVYNIPNTELNFVHRVMKGDISILNQYQYLNQ
jgi:prepilin-type N-terminal cleavage/methylation domain-containing protein